MSENIVGNEMGDKYEIIEKRLEDLKWFIGVFSGTIALVFAGLSIFLGINLSSERASIKEEREQLKTQVMESLGKSEKPLLQLETIDGKPLNGAMINGWIAPNENGVQQIHIQYVIRNIGNGRSGPMFLRFYSTDIHFNDPDTDQTGYKYSTFINYTAWDPAELLGGVSMPYTSNINISKNFKIVDGQTEILIRLYYSDREMVDAKVRLKKKE